jgi:hypothetical protein
MEKVVRIRLNPTQTLILDPSLEPMRPLMKHHETYPKMTPSMMRYGLSSKLGRAQSMMTMTELCGILGKLKSLFYMSLLISVLLQCL